MRIKKVGTFSMAVVLMASGILILISKFLHISALEYFTKYWPLILVLLGFEVIFAYFRYRKNSSIKIGVDFLSLIIILAIILINYGLYAFLGNNIDNENSTSNVETLIIEDKIFEVGTNIEKVIIENFEDTNLKIKTCTEDELSIDGDLLVKNSESEEIDNFINGDFIDIEESGKVLYLSINEELDKEDSKNIVQTNLNLVLPSTKMIEINNVNDLNLHINRLDEDILVNKANDIVINLEEIKDFNIYAKVDSKDKLDKNIEWLTEVKRNISGKIIYYEGLIVEGASNNYIKINDLNNIIIKKI